jgi:hypothetical protein
MAIRGGRTEPKTTALPDGELVRTCVFADPGPSHVHDVSRSVAQPLLEESGSVAIGDEADVMAIRLVRDCQTPLPRLRAYFGFLRGTERKVGAPQLILVQYTQHIGLVFAGINRAMELDVVAASDQ